MAEELENNRDLDIFRRAVGCSTISRRSQRPEQQILSLGLNERVSVDTSKSGRPYVFLEVVIYLQDYLVAVMHNNATVICMRGSGTFNELVFGTATGFVFGRGSYTPLEHGQTETVPGNFIRTFYIKDTKNKSLAKLIQRAGYPNKFSNDTIMDFLQDDLSILAKCLLICKFLMMSFVDPSFSQCLQQLALRNLQPTLEDLKFLENFNCDTFEFGFIGQKVSGNMKDYYVLYRTLESSLQLIFIYEIDETDQLTILNAENLNPLLKVTCVRSLAGETPIVSTPGGRKVGENRRASWIDSNNAKISRVFLRSDQLFIILQGSSLYPRTQRSACIKKHNQKRNFITGELKVYFEPIRCAMLLATLVPSCDLLADLTRVNQTFNSLLEVQRYAHQLR